MEITCTNFEKDTHVVSVMTDQLRETVAEVRKKKETVSEVRDEKDNRPLLHQIRRPRKTDGEGENPSKESGNRDESSSDKRSKIPRRCANCSNPSCVFWHPSVCQNCKSKTRCTFGNKGFFRHVEAEEKPSKKSKKGGARGSVALLKESAQFGCVFQDSHLRKSILREERKFGTKRAVKFSKGTWHQIKMRERKGPSRGIIQKCEPHECSRCAPNFGERSHEETLHQERCARRVAWD